MKKIICLLMIITAVFSASLYAGTSLDDWEYQKQQKEKKEQEQNNNNKDKDKDKDKDKNKNGNTGNSNGGGNGDTSNGGGGNNGGSNGGTSTGGGNNGTTGGSGGTTVNTQTPPPPPTKDQIYKEKGDKSQKKVSSLKAGLQGIAKTVSTTVKKLFTKDKAKELNDTNSEKIVEKEKETQEAITEIDQKEDVLQEDKSGDPVKIAEGYYEQTETDLIIGVSPVIEVKRNYSSQSGITSSFGYGWSTNLDERIILCFDAGVEELKTSFADYVAKLGEEIESLKSSYISSYNVSSIYNAKTELSTRINRCNEEYNNGQALISEVSALIAEAEKINEDVRKKKESREGTIGSKLSDSNSEDDSSDETVSTEVIAAFYQQKAELEALCAEFISKRNQAQEAYNSVDSDLALLSELNMQYETAVRKHAEYVAACELRSILKNRNQKVMFSGMGAEYEETGFNTINLIDGEGFPHVMYETASGSGCWKSHTDKNYLKCEKSGNGFVLYEKNGTVKTFDDAGFIIQIKDRNGNSVSIRRDATEKIEYIETSSNEHVKFEYENGFIRKIINLRDTSENVVYEYIGNRLVSVKDSDGDIVTMEYDDGGHMTALKKCDGSVVQFEYGEVTADGKVLTTATTNEEGFAERFEYDRTGKRTDYIDHDGNRTSYWYDDKHRTVREVHPDGSVITNAYDSEGNLVSVNENGNVVTYTYDERGNKLSASYSDGSVERWTYDSFSQVTSYTDRDGVWYEYVRDLKGNLVEYRTGNGTVYRQTFDAKGNVTEKTVYGENLVTTSYSYDDYGNLKSKITDGVKTEYEYDGKGQVTKISLNGKIISEYKYEKGKTVQLDYNGLETTYLTNDRKDMYKVIQKDTKTDAVHETRIEYDRRHLPLKVFKGDGSSEVLTNSYLYTAEGKLKAEVIHGKESWIKLYSYKNGQMNEIKQFKVIEPVETSISDAKLQEFLNKAGENIYTQKVEYRILNSNRKLLTVTDGFGSASLFEYDSYGNLVKNTDANGEVRELGYTRAGRTSAEQSLHGGWYEYGYSTDGLMNRAGEQGKSSVRQEYYPDGSVKSFTDRYGKITYYHYDNRGRVAGSQSDYQKVWYEYDDFDRVTKEVVGNNASESDAVYYAAYEYSNNGRSVVVTEGGKYKKQYELDAFENVLKITDGNNNERSYVYDCQNQMIENYEAYGNKVSYEYNALGAVSKVTLPDGAVTKYEYNFMGQLVKVTDDCGIVYTASYDKAGRLVKEQNRADSEKSYEYDAGGRITKVFCGGELVQSYSYGNNSRTITVKDGNGNDYLYNYDAFGRLLNERNRNGLEQNYLYDEEGELKSKNNFDGGTTTINYSGDRTVRTVCYSDGSENRFVYDMMGNITEVQNAYGKTQYRYDQAGYLIYQKDVTTGEEIHFEYDDVGNRTKLYSSNRETLYTYGKNNEVKEIFDNKQRISIKLTYDKNGREVLRQFGNKTKEETLYDKAGRIAIKKQISEYGEIQWAEGYVYGVDGKRTATVDNQCRVTLYEYNNKGQLSTVYYPYTQELVNLLKTEAEENGLSANNDFGENRFLTSAEKTNLVPLLNSMQYGLAYNLPTMQVFIKESYSYDKNGNRATKTTPFGTIEYTYDKENCLLSSGSKGQSLVIYSYDHMGNLLTETSAAKITKYAYNAQNRLIYCEVTDNTEMTYNQTTYAYDAFGRRVLVQDANEAALYTVYDGLTFEVLKQAPIFENGLFTDANNLGVKYTRTGRPTGDRYRYLSDNDKNDGNRYFYLDEGSYKTTDTRYRGERTQIIVNSTMAAQGTTDYGAEYFTTDLMGSISTVTNTHGTQNASYTYDVFGSLIQGDLTGTTDFGYLGKQHDQTTKLYNYGYRDYKPQAARFTTIDPIRDGNNWFAYVNNDPVNFIDLLGLCDVNDNSKNVSDDILNQRPKYPYRQNAPELAFIPEMKMSGCNFMSELYGVQRETNINFSAKEIDTLVKYLQKKDNLSPNAKVGEKCLTDKMKLNNPDELINKAFEMANKNIKGRVNWGNEKNQQPTWTIIKGITPLNNPHFQYADKDGNIVWDPYYEEPIEMKQKETLKVYLFDED